MFDFFLPGTPVMHIGDIPLRVEMAITGEELAKGLSGRNELSNVEGFLLIFPEADYHSIWMKEMRFPIDIIWIDDDLMVISIEKNVSPDSYPRIFRPKKPARYAVETNTQYSDIVGIRPGQIVTLPILPKGNLEK